MPDNKPLVSVVMPVFNGETTVRLAVTSVLSQTMGSLELLVCDDGSTDNTLQVLNGIKDERLVVVANPGNMGPGASRDRGIEVARGRWIALIDADDKWQPGRLEALLAVTDDADDVLVFDDIMTCHHGVGGDLIPWRRLRGSHAFGATSIGWIAVPVEEYIVQDRLLIKPLVSRSFVMQHGVRHSNRRFAEDAEFFLQLALHGARFRYVPQAHYLYRITPGSATSSAKDPRLMRLCLEDCVQWTGWPERVRRAFDTKIKILHANEAVYFAWGHARQGRLLSALRVLMRQSGSLGVLLRRGSSHLRYQVNRLLSGGKGR